MKETEKQEFMGTGHHQWLSNDEVVAMVTRLYETPLKARPCPAPLDAFVCLYVCLWPQRGHAKHASLCPRAALWAASQTGKTRQ